MMKCGNLPGVFSLAMVFSCVFAGNAGAQSYYHGSEDLPGRANWMKRLPDDIRLSEMSIPGTHESATSRYGGDAVLKQSLTITQQLNAGIRFLDLRINQGSNTFDMWGGGYSQGASFQAVLTEMTEFLRAHPSETLLVRVKQEGGSAGHIPFEWMFEYYRSFFGNSLFADPKDANPMLGELRGKLLILPDFARSELAYGIGYETLKAQESGVSTNWSLYGKWEQVKSHLLTSVQDRSGALYINYLSATGGSFPYFVASGKSSPQNDAPQLLTGRTTVGGWWYSWPDFPRTSCWGSWCSIQFLGTNQLTVNYLKGKPWRGFGIIAADFPGPDLIGAIVQANVNTRLDSRITQTSTGRCIGVGSAQYEGAPLQLMPCQGKSSGQRIAIDDLTLKVGRESRKLCMDVSGGRAIDHQSVMLWGCHGDSNQQWAVRDDGRIESQRRSPDSKAMCLTVEGFPSSLTVRPCGVDGADQTFAVKSASEV